MATSELAIINRGPENYEFSAIYDGERYYTEFNYNDRNDTWYMTLKDANREILLQGLACLTNVQLLVRRFRLDDVFDFGDIFISDTSGEGADPGYENFGDVVSAFYVSIING